MCWIIHHPSVLTVRPRQRNFCRHRALGSSETATRHKWTLLVLSLTRALLSLMNAAGHGNLPPYHDFRYQSSCSSQRAALWPLNQLCLTSIRYCRPVTNTWREVLIRILACERARNHRQGQTESRILCWANCELDLAQPFASY